MKKVLYVVLLSVTNFVIADVPVSRQPNAIEQEAVGVLTGSFQKAFPHLAGHLSSREARQADFASQLATELSGSRQFAGLDRDQKAMIFNNVMLSMKEAEQYNQLADQFHEGQKADQLKKDQRLLGKLRGGSNLHKGKMAGERLYSDSAVDALDGAKEASLKKLSNDGNLTFSDEEYLKGLRSNYKEQPKLGVPSLLETDGNQEVGLKRIFPHLLRAKEKRQEDMEALRALQAQYNKDRADQLVSVYEADQSLDAQEGQYYKDRQRYVLARKEHEGFKEPLNQKGFSVVTSALTLTAPKLEEKKEEVGNEKEKTESKWNFVAKVARFFNWLQHPTRV